MKRNEKIKKRRKRVLEDERYLKEKNEDMKRNEKIKIFDFNRGGHQNKIKWNKIKWNKIK